MSRMPIVFIGHGSPMNAIEDNEFTKKWEKIAQEIPKPKAILAISAHWYTDGIRVLDAEHPKMTYDMYGFPKELYEIKYNAPGDKKLADRVKELIQENVTTDNSWGYDHGTWSILVKMYPKADIPVIQLSVDRNLNAEDHFQIGKELKALRDEGVLIFASGNVVHNLSRVDFGKEGGEDWAYRFDDYIQENIFDKKYENVINFRKAGKDAFFSFATPEHFFPLLYILGAVEEEDKVTVYNDSCVMGALSMTSYLFK